MTFDFRYLNLCDHRATDRRSIEPDGQTIKLELPLSDPKSVQVLRNGINVPQDHVIYAWAVVLDGEGSSDFYNDDIATTDIVLKRAIKLLNTTKSLDDVWRVLYTVPSDFCRKCGGSRIINDWSFDEAGRIVIVEDEAKLGQDIRKIMITIRESHLEHPWYGTNLYNLSGTKFLSGLNIRLAAEIQETLERYVTVQMKQNVYQDLTDNERVRELVGIDTDRGQGDNSDILFIEITLKTDAQTISNVTFGLAASGQLG